MKLKGLAALALSTTLVGQAHAANPNHDFNGAWSGTITILDLNLYNPMPIPGPEEKALPPMEIALEIAGPSARAFTKYKERWEELKPGAFGAATHLTNAVVAATDSSMARDKSSGWIETWNLTLSRKDDDTLYVYWVRAVNNFQLPAMSDPNARFVMIGHGEFRRSASPSGEGRFSVSAKSDYAPCTPAAAACGFEAAIGGGEHHH